MSSFGTETGQTMSGDWSEVANALFVVGALSTRPITVSGGPVLLAMAGHSSFSEQEFALRVHEILGAERAFWRTPAPAWYAIVLVPFEAGTSGGGGSAFTNGVSLSLAPGEHFGEETESLLAHEAFHGWNPNALGVKIEGSRLGWFVEGFTTFYQDIMLERSGLLARGAYVRRVNAILRDYLTASMASISPDSAPGQPLDDEEARYREPYLRGAVIALWLDAQIRSQTAARWSMDDLMRALLADRGQPLTPERIFASAGRFVDAATVRQLQSFVGETTAIPLLNVLGPCAPFIQKQVWTFSLGIPVAELSIGAVLHGVEQHSAAYQAGLRDGQMLLAWSFWYGDADREVVLTVRDPGGAGGPRRIRYLPHGREVTISQAEVVPSCTEGPEEARERVSSEP